MILPYHIYRFCPTGWTTKTALCWHPADSGPSKWTDYGVAVAGLSKHAMSNYQTSDREYIYDRAWLEGCPNIDWRLFT